MTTYTAGDTSICDRCGRPLAGKGYIEISGWKICGICQFESRITPAKTFNPYDAKNGGKNAIKQQI